MSFAVLPVMEDHGKDEFEFEVDIECGRVDGGSVTIEDQANMVNSDVDVDSVESVVIDLNIEDMDSAERKVVKENRKKTSTNKKASKPPRPPRGPSLDVADQKLIKEIAELAMLKRIRIERVKALKKMKATKPSSSSSNNSLFAMIFTIIFCLVIVLQGINLANSLLFALNYFHWVRSH